VATVRAGEFPEAAIDRKVRRLLVLPRGSAPWRASVPAAPQLAPVEDRIAIAPGASAAGTVLVRKEGGPASPGPALSSK
jgi:beta-glucosidase